VEIRPEKAGRSDCDAVWGYLLLAPPVSKRDKIHFLSQFPPFIFGGWNVTINRKYNIF
jgi:hypothetical protein